MSPIARLRSVMWIGLALAFMAGFAALRHHFVDEGVMRERAAWRAKEQQRLATEAERYADDVRLGKRAAAAAAADARGVQAITDQLRVENRHASLALVQPVACAAAGPRRADHLRAPDEAMLGADAGAEPAPAGDAQAVPKADDGVAVVRLSGDAVRLWNSALAAEPLPAGACGADGAAGGACAADAGLTLEDAWDNHITNAGSCAVDRRRYRRLIDYLNARGAGEQRSMQ